MNNMETIMEGWRKNSAAFDDKQISEKFANLIKKHDELADAKFVESVFGIKPIITEGRGFDVATQRLILEENARIQQFIDEGVADNLKNAAKNTTLGKGVGIVKNLYSIYRLASDDESTIDSEKVYEQFSSSCRSKTLRLVRRSFIKPINRVIGILNNDFFQRHIPTFSRPILATLEFVKEKIESFISSALFRNDGIKGFMANITIGASLITFLKFGFSKLINGLLDIGKLIDKMKEKPEMLDKIIKMVKELKGDADSFKQKIENFKSNIYDKILSLVLEGSLKAAFKAIVDALAPIAEVAVNYFSEPISRAKGALKMTDDISRV